METPQILEADEEVSMKHSSFCQCGGESQVIDSRITKTGIRRRRRCLSCTSRWTTHELKIDAALISSDSLCDVLKAMSTLEETIKDVKNHVEAILLAQAMLERKP